MLSLLQKAGFKPGLALHSTIPKALMVAAMAGGAGSLLSGSSAQAAATCTFGNYISADPTCYTALTLAAGDKLLTFTDIPLATEAYGGTITLANLGLDIYTVSTNFIGPLGQSVGPDTLGYDIEITLPGNIFNGVKLGAVSATDNTLVIKSETSSPSLFGQLQVTATTSDPFGTGIYQFVPGSPTKLRILDTFSTPAGTLQAPGSLTSFTNTFRQTSNVPGPLPLMGAGMAFGFSRKLRSRIKSSAKAKA